MKPRAPRSLQVILVSWLFVLSLSAWPAAGQTCPAPLARQDWVSLPAGSGPTYDVVVPNPLLNDSSGSGRVLSRQMTLPQGDPVTGLLTAGPDGTLRFTGTRDAVRTRYFSYVVQEAGGGSDEGAIRISEGLDFAAPPAIAADYFGVPEGCLTYSFDVLANDAFPSNSTVRLVGVVYGPNSRGAVTIEGGVQLRYQEPCWGYTGPDEFQYVVAVNGEEYLGLVHVDVSPSTVDSSAYPCFNLLELNDWLPVGVAHDETQRDGVLDVGCSHNGEEPPYPPLGYCWDWGDGTPLEPETGCAADTSYSVGAVCEATNPARCYTGRRYVHRYAQLGSYIVRLRVMWPEGHWSDWTGREVTLQNAPPTVTLDPIVCTALDCPLHASALDDFDPPASLAYTWDFGDDSPLGSGSGLTHRYPDLGSYPLTLVVRDSQGAVDVQTRMVEVFDRAPAASFLVASCGDRCQLLTSTSTDDFGLASYRWTYRQIAGGTTGLLSTTATAQLQTALGGEYAVTLEVTDGAGQVGTATATVLVAGLLRARTDWVELPPGATTVTVSPLANDGPGPGLTVVTFGQGALGTVSTPAAGSLRYTLTGARPSTADGFWYEVQNGSGERARGMVRVVATPIGEVGRIDAVTSTAQTVPLRRSYPQLPLVFALPASANEADPVTVRLLSPKNDSFLLRLEEPAGTPHGAETVDYLAVTPPWPGGGDGSGLGFLADGRAFAAGRLLVRPNLGGSTSTDRWAYVSLPRLPGATGAPVVLAQVQGANDPSWVSARVDQVTANGFRVALELPEGATVAHGGETVAWIALPPGAGAVDGLPYEVNEKGTRVDESFQRVPLRQLYPQPPLVLGTLGSRLDVDPAVLRRRLVDTAGVELAVEEDAMADAERDHGFERVSLLAFAEPGLLAGSLRTLQAADGGGLVGVDDRMLVAAAQQTVLPVLANDRPGSGSLELLGFTQPVFGRLRRIAPGPPPSGTSPPLDNGLDGEFVLGGDVLYQPPSPAFRGWDAFEYTVRDGAGNRATMTVFVEVVGENEQ